MNKIIVILSLLTLPAFSHAAGIQFGRIVEIKGSGFISYEGQTHEIKKGEVIYGNSEIVVENSGQVTFTDNADHRFFIGNASSIAVFPKKIELRSGDVWMQSQNHVDDYQLTSANAIVNYQGGEAIFSYDSMKGRTQLMVINGLMKLSNLKSPELNLTVAEGNFSFVDPTYEEGMPRDPTPVGSKTYGQLVALFPGISPMDKHSAEIFKDKVPAKEHAARSVASVAEDAAPVADSSVEVEYKKSMMSTAKATNVVETKVKNKTTKTHVQNLVVQIYGLKDAEKSVTTDIYDTGKVIFAQSSARAPASVPEAVTETVMDQPVPHSENMNIIPTTPYKESDKLINQLNKL